MSETSYRLKQEQFAHFLWLGLMPSALHAGFALFVGEEGETSLAMVFSASMAAAFSGRFLGKRGYGPVVSALVSAWPIVAATHWHGYWAVGLSSPGGACQQIVRRLGWSDASATEAVAVLIPAFGAAGWLANRFERWYKKKTGRPLLDE